MVYHGDGDDYPHPLESDGERVVCLESEIRLLTKIVDDLKKIVDNKSSRIKELQLALARLRSKFRLNQSSRKKAHQRQENNLIQLREAHTQEMIRLQKKLATLEDVNNTLSDQLENRTIMNNTSK